jgi:hypothetical protein
MQRIATAEVTPHRAKSGSVPPEVARNGDDGGSDWPKTAPTL